MEGIAIASKAYCFAMIDENEKAIDWIEKDVNMGFINYPFLAEYNLLLKNLRKEERFKVLLEKVKYRWENFEE